METIKINVRRDVSFFGVAMPIRIRVNGLEISKIKSGKSFLFEIPFEKTNLGFSMVGNEAFSSMNKVITILPELCKSGVINIDITTKVKGLLFLKSELVVNVAYL